MRNASLTSAPGIKAFAREHDATNSLCDGDGAYINLAWTPNF